jgi:membrane protease YdiL (CAAX protease family)
MKTKEFIITIFFIITSLLVYAFFPAKNNFEQVAAALIFFIILPFLLNKFFLKKNLSFYGLSMGDWRQGIKWSGYSLIVMGIVFSILAYYFGFLKNYSVPTFILGNFANFLFYEFVISLFFVFMYEFYFRGFVLFIFAQKIGWWSVLAQAGIFCILVFSGMGQLSIYSFLPYIVFSPFAGIITYKSRSILYSGIVQFVILLILNVLVIKMAV